MAFFRETLRAWLTRLESEVDDIEGLEATFRESYFAPITGSNSISANVYADLTPLTVTVPVETGDVLVVHAYLSTINTTASQPVHAQLVVDGVAVQATAMPGGGGSGTLLWRATGLSAGDRVVKIQWKVPGGTGTCNAGSGQQGGGLIVERVRA